MVSGEPVRTRAETLAEAGGFHRNALIADAERVRAEALDRLRERCLAAGWDLADVVCTISLDADVDASARNEVRFTIEARRRR